MDFNFDISKTAILWETHKVSLVLPTGRIASLPHT